MRNHRSANGHNDFLSCFSHWLREKSNGKDKISPTNSRIKVQSLWVKASADSWILIQLILIFTKMTEIYSWEGSRHFLEMVWF